MCQGTAKLIVVTGAGGFIGGGLVAALRARGLEKIRAVDIKPLAEWYQRFDGVENLSLDLNLKGNCEISAQGAAEIYNLAANMGGMGFIENNKALCMLSVLINTHMLQAALKHGVERYFYASSACVYNADKQTVGKSFFRSACAAISARITASEHGSRGFTTSMARGAPGTAAAKRRLPQSAEK